MGLDLVEALALERQADFTNIGTGAGAGELEGSFERGGGLHPIHMDAFARKT